MNNKLTLLREFMTKNGVDACVIPTSDPHLSEYTCDCYKLREWFSGFTGSAGTLVVTKSLSGLWTDGRYYIQAEKELRGTGIELFRASEKETISIEEFLLENLEKGQNVGVDGRLFSKNYLDKIKIKLLEKEIVVKTRFDASVLWENRPPMPMGKAFSLKEKYAGESAKSKISRLRKLMEEERADYYVSAMTDSVMWLLNIRGSDVAYTPVMLSYLFVSKENVILFAQKEKTSDISASCFEIREYGEFYVFLKNLDKEKSLVVDFSETNYEIINSATCKIKNHSDFIQSMKAIKNETELSNIKKAYIKENIALIKSFYEIYSSVGTIDECDVQDVIERKRIQGDGYLYPSFCTVAAFGENAAIVHYSPQKSKCAKIENNAMLLIDTGGQYLEGTTDTTRTLILGDISCEVKKLYTSVLKGNIALSRAIFPKGSTGKSIDILAREPLWKMGKNYRHGTGHGVGYLLCVHEGPHSISPASDVELKCGMTVTDEPGIYEENEFGVRIENHLSVVKKYNGEYGEFLGFEVLNFCPIGTNGILTELLTEDEKKWLNDYNEKCQKLYKEHLTVEEYQWLVNYTKKI